MTDDGELLRRYARKRCEAAFAELVHRHIGLIYNAALRRLNGDAHLAEDAVQIVFTDLARKAGALQRHPALAGWLHTSTRYAATVLVRCESRRKARESAALAMDFEPAPSETVDWEKLRPLIDGELDRLGDTDRQAVLLRFFGGRSFAEIGAELRVSEEASRKRVARAVEQLRRGLVRRGITTTAGALAAALAAAPAFAVPASLASTVTTVATATAAGGSLVAALFTFMSTTKISGAAVAACSLVGVATVGTVGLVSWSSQQELELAQLEAVQAQSATLARQLVQLREAAAANAYAADARTRAVTPEATAAARGDALAAEETRRQLLLATSPEYAPFRQQELRLRVQRELGPFFAERGYSPEKIETLTRSFALLFDAEDKHRKMVDAANPTAAIKPDPALVAESKQVMDQIQAFLGDADAEEMRRHSLARQQLRRARDFGLDLIDAGQSLTPAQELALARTMAESRDSKANPVFAQMQRLPPDADGLTPLERWQADRARAFLSAEQAARFETFLRDARAKSALVARARG